jgi:hypothetical protein
VNKINEYLTDCDPGDEMKEVEDFIIEEIRKDLEEFVKEMFNEFNTTFQELEDFDNGGFKQ